MSVSAEFTCKCGLQKGWVTDGEILSNPCPMCGRIYKGVYNPKTLTIDAIEIDSEPTQRKIRHPFDPACWKKKPC